MRNLAEEKRLFEPDRCDLFELKPPEEADPGASKERRRNPP